MATVTCPGCQERDERIAALERRVAELEALARDLSARLGTNATNSGRYFRRLVLQRVGGADGVWVRPSPAGPVSFSPNALQTPQHAYARGRPPGRPRGVAGRGQARAAATGRGPSWAG
jgi:hypothetical protein